MHGCHTLDLTHLKALALDETVNAVVITDRDGRIQWHNSAFTHLTGYHLDEVVGRTLRILYSGKHNQDFYRDLWETILSGRPWQGEITNRRKDGSLYTEEQTITPVRGPNGEITHFIAIKNDISDRKIQQERLEYLATHDILTNLPNRLVLEEALQKAIDNAKQGIPSVLAFLDLDNLKLVNDTLGHVAGDEALKALANRLRATLRADDLLARVAGDEFVVLLEGTGLREAAHLAGRIRQSVSERPIFVNNNPLYITVSIGLVPVVPEIGVKRLLSRADAAMYEAKQRGGNRIEVADFSASYLGGLAANFSSGQQARRFLENERLLFYYQPIVSLKDRRVRAYEALLRVKDDDGKILSAGKFLEAAERGGFMNEIDRWVLTEALRVLKTHPHLILAINLSGHSINDESLIDWMMKQLPTLNSGVSRLGIEITETAAIHDMALAEQCLRRLRTVVGWISIDDFGAGFNSFGYLRHFPVDGLKIDGSLIQDVLHNSHHQAIVRSIRVLAEGFQIDTVAECIEDEETARFLTDLGITHGQGYYFARPAPWPENLCLLR